MPIATAVSWFHDCAGGEFAFYPDGPDAPPVAHPVRFNTAILLDTDTIFHGVDRVQETAEPVDRLKPGMRLRFAGGDTWCVEVAEGTIVTRYRCTLFRDVYPLMVKFVGHDREELLATGPGELTA